MRIKVIALASVVMFSGCTRYSPRAPAPIKFYLKQIDAELSSSDWLLKYNALPQVTPADLAIKTSERNRLLNEFVWVIDNTYGKFEVSFYSGKATQDIAGDFLQLGLTGAAALTAGAHAKTVLAIVATTAAGGKASIDARWFDQQSRYAVVAQMQALRATQLALIEQGMKQGIAEYPLAQGIRDAQDYYQAGSVVSALQAIASSAGSQATAAKQALILMRH